MTGRRLFPEIFLLALAVVVLEVSYTRLFSFKLVYYFTYLLIGIALLGLGSGGVLVALMARLRRAVAGALIPACGAVASLGVLVGYAVIAWMPLNAFDLILALQPFAADIVLREGLKLAAVCAALFVPFLAAGIAVAAILATGTERVHRLYFADLVGAGLGCALCVPLIARLSPPGAICVAGAVFALAGLRLAAARARPLVPVLVSVGVLLVFGALRPDRLPDPVPDRVKGLRPRVEGGPEVLFSRWSPVFRIDVTPAPLEPDSRRLIYHDAMIGSALNRYDGDATKLARFERDQRAYPFAILGPGARVAIIGAAGGHDILAALHFDAEHVTAVELNPVTVSLLTTHFADWSGHLAAHPRVTLVNGEGRWFLARDPARYDLIWFVAPDSYAAMNAATSGAFVLSESYLYTTGMIRESLAHLTDGGLICAQFGEMDFETKPNRTARYLATARAAFRELGIHDFERHVLLATAPGLFTTSSILLSKRPFAEVPVERFREQVARVPGARVRYLPGQRDLPPPVAAVLSLPEAELAPWFSSSPFDLRPVTDDAPFFWHFVRFRDALEPSRPGLLGQLEEGAGERLLLVFLVVATVFAAAFLLAPLLLARDVWRRIPGKARAGVYFAALGTGFMFLEITLIQRLTLFLGYPTYSLTVTLFGLLVFTGVGSLASERLMGPRRRTLVALAAALIVLVTFYRFGLGPLVDRAIGWPFPARVALALAALAPLGAVLGCLMPIGLRTVAGLTTFREEYVAWSWAVNGFFSVVSSVLATVLSMALGFDAVMLVALAVYLAGMVALDALPEPAAVG